MNNRLITILSLLSLLILNACSGGGSSTTSVTSFELLDPIAAANNRFGSKVVILPNGNIVVAAPLDSSVATNNGAVHLFNPYTQTLIASFYGDTEDDQLGSKSITALANSNFVIASPLDDEAVVDGGTVRLIHGTTGAQISVLEGDAADDFLGRHSITALANSNFVIASQFDDEAVVDGGTVRLIHGTTGAQISVLEGDTASDHISSSITALANSNFVFASQFDDEAVVDGGTVRLIHGTTGAQISVLEGNTASDRIGGSITALANNNFVIASAFDDEAVVNGGTVRLIHGTTGVQISVLEGDTADDFLGSNGITALANNYFVIASELDDEAVIDGGTVRLVGVDGVQISVLEGDTADDYLGRHSITALANSNFVIASPLDDEAVVDGGTVRLIHGTTGAQISVLEGDTADDYLGSDGITALANNNFVIASTLDDETVVDGGTVRLIHGTTGAQISVLEGDTADDYLGNSSITALANNNFVIASTYDDEAVVDGGTVRLIHGTTGVQISVLEGDTADDRLGSWGVTALANNNYLVSSHLDDQTVVDGGTVRQMNGTTGNPIRTIVGTVSGDILGTIVIDSPKNDFYILSLPNKDNNTMSDSGFVTLIARPVFN